MAKAPGDVRHISTAGIARLGGSIELVKWSTHDTYELIRGCFLGIVGQQWRVVIDGEHAVTELPVREWSAVLP